MGSNRSQDGATVVVEVCFAAFSGNDRKKRARGDKYGPLTLGARGRSNWVVLIRCAGGFRKCKLLSSEPFPKQS